MSDALASCAALIEAAPSSADVYRTEAYVLRQMSRVADAIMSLGRAMELDEGEPDDHFTRARWFVELGEYNKAIHDLDELNRLESRHGRTYYVGMMRFYRALALCFLGRFHEAEGELSEVAEDTRTWAIGKLWTKAELLAWVDRGM